MSLRVGRIATVTLSITLVGAIIGAIVGALLFMGWRLLLRGGDVLAPPMSIGALAGATVGAVLAPITAWVFLRRVPLGRAFLRTTIGTTVGAMVGLGLDGLGVSTFAYMPAGLVGALAGFLVAAVWLWMATRTSRRPKGMEATGPGSPV